MNRPIFTTAMVCGFLAAIPVACPLRAPAHDFFTSCIQHRVAVSLGARHVDVTVQLTFFEEGSEHERERMDTNRDGRLSRAETDAYLEELEPGLARGVTLRFGSHSVTLIPLRAPELDLLGQDRVGRGHHRLTLCYFGLAPSNVSPGTELAIEDRLWPGVRALASLQVEGTDSAWLEALPAPDPLYPAARDNEPRTLKARVLAPPTPPSKDPADSGQSKSPATDPHNIESS